MINDPKWRTIARISQQKIGDVIAVYVHMMTCASNATERGRTEGWCDEDVATALDIDTDQVAAICQAMQGRVLDGDRLAGWEKRQPLREDGSASRSKEWREAQKAQNRTQPNATERTETLEKSREEETKKRTRKTKAASPSAMPDVLPDWLPLKPWNDFLAMRQKIKKPVTEQGIPLAIKKLGELMAAGHDPQAVLENSTMNSYLGLFPPPAPHRPASGVGVDVGLGPAGQATAAAALEWLDGGTP